MRDLPEKITWPSLIYNDFADTMYAIGGRKYATTAKFTQTSYKYNFVDENQGWKEFKFEMNSIPQYPSLTSYGYFIYASGIYSGPSNNGYGRSKLFAMDVRTDTWQAFDMQIGKIEIHR